MVSTVEARLAASPIVNKLVARRSSRPQRLKPFQFSSTYGTTEVAPFPKQA